MRDRHLTQAGDTASSAIPASFPGTSAAQVGATGRHGPIRGPVVSATAWGSRVEQTSKKNASATGAAEAQGPKHDPRESLNPHGTEAADKEHASLAAEFALAGHELVRLADGTFLASRWGGFKSLATADDARAFLARVTGKTS